MTSDGRCSNCGGEMTTGGCPKCNSVRVYNYPVSYAPPCAKCAQLEADLAVLRQRHAEAEADGYVLAARLLQSDIIADDTERIAMEHFLEAAKARLT